MSTKDKNSIPFLNCSVPPQRAVKIETGGELSLRKPLVYQEVAGARREIASAYVLEAESENEHRTAGVTKTAVLTVNLAPTYTLTVTKAGTVSWTVSSSPAGISCGTDCTEPYNSGTLVNLSATAAAVR